MQEIHLLSLLSLCLLSCCSKFVLWCVCSLHLPGLYYLTTSKARSLALHHGMSSKSCSSEANRRALVCKTWSRQSKQLEAWESGEATSSLRRVSRAGTGAGWSPGKSCESKSLLQSLREHPLDRGPQRKW